MFTLYKSTNNSKSLLHQRTQIFHLVWKLVLSCSQICDSQNTENHICSLWYCLDILSIDSKTSA